MLKFLTIFFLLCLISCSDDEKTVNSEIILDYSKITPACFKEQPSSPLIGVGSQTTTFDGSTWNDPHVLKVGEQYIMYASSGLYTGGDPGTLVRLLHDLLWRFTSNMVLVRGSHPGSLTCFCGSLSSLQAVVLLHTGPLL